MFWIALPIIGVIGKIIYDAVTDDNESTSPRKKSILELNLERLYNQTFSSAGYKIAIIGQPGAGKSSLLKKMTKGKVKPLPIIGAQTDATDWSNDVNCNLLSIYENYVFVDVPGYDTLAHPICDFLSYFPFKNFDAFIFVIHGKLHSSDESIFQLIKNSGKKIFIASSFADSLDDNEMKLVEHDIKTRLSISNSNPILFFSNRTGHGIEPIFNAICH